MKEQQKYYYQKLFEYFKPYLPRFIFALFCMACVSLLNGASRLLIKPMIDKVFINKEITTLFYIVLAIPAIYLLLGVFNYAKTYLMAYIAQRITLEIRNKTYEHLHLLSLDFYTKGSTGNLMSRLTNDIMAIQTALNKAPATIVCDGLTVIVLIGILFYLHWKFALVSLIVFPIASIPIIKFSQRMRQLSKQSQKQMAEIYINLQESISAINVTKAFNRETTEIERFRKTNKKFYDTIIRFIKTEAFSSPVMEFIGALALAIVLFFAGKDVITGVWSAGSFFAFFGSAFSIYQPLKNFAALNPQIQQALSAAERVFELLQEKPKVIEMPSAYPLPPLKEKISYENVYFSYNGKNYILEDISFSIRSGEIVAIVGPSGSGKTTIANLLLRFYDPTSGKISIDGHDIKNVSIKSLRDQIGLVTQEVVLFNETVKYNIAYGKFDATEEEIINSAKLAYAHDFIMKMPQGYDTIVGERGVLLSGGEKQRIAIARAIIKNPKILILDEATSALDAESEMLIQEALEKLMKNRTTLIIAHRFSTIKKSDRIIVIDQGKIVDIGTHEELFKKEGLYRKLHQLQLI